MNLSPEQFEKAMNATEKTLAFCKTEFSDLGMALTGLLSGFATLASSYPQNVPECARNLRLLADELEKTALKAPGQTSTQLH